MKLKLGLSVWIVTIKLIDDIKLDLLGKDSSQKTTSKSFMTKNILKC